MYFGHLYFGPLENKDYFGAYYFGKLGSVPAGVSYGLKGGGGGIPGGIVDRVRPHPWLVREWQDEEILTILTAIMRAIDN